MGNNLMKKPWRDVEFSTRNMDDLKNKLINYESPNQGIPANILLLGRSGHGKSSFINTCETALSDRIRSRAVTASSTGSSTTQHFLKYQLTSFQNQKETPINVNVMDTIGWEPQTFTFEMFNKILNGQIEDKQSFSDKTEITSEPRNKVHCVAYVADMDQFQNMELDDLDSFKRFGRYARQKENINTFVIITKVDACLPEGTSISDIYKVKNIETRLSEYPHLVLDSLLENNHICRELDTKDFPFRLRRKQFPIVPAFAMTINKAQGQTVHNLGLYLPTPCFSHGQLYVALSRVTARSNIKALIEGPHDEEEDGVYTKNIVYRQIFQ
ncbi:uncharacterized protein LOC133361288 isoform X1 [Lethenteron reissneri]|uniref:uncharacterized protein LOC133361288 isoform X1 n=1 Tax=Lethenteron reissneri TaxID=7753 RepID=UPI002AB6FEB1|nr:uncharacterized protein LOC133361288 isoform X1 [Lethenteron reissneri]